MNEKIIELFIELHKNLDPLDEEMNKFGKGISEYDIDLSFNLMEGLLNNTCDINRDLEHYIKDGEIWTLYESVARCIENEEYEKIPQLKKEIERKENEILYTNICAVP